MLKIIKELPPEILGLQAEGKLTHQDYQTVVVPVLEEARKKGRDVWFLYQFGPDFSGFSIRAMWDDFRVGLKYLKLFKRCAIVTDVKWLSKATHFAGILMPCPVQTFTNNEFKNAVQWLLAGQELMKV